jgi:hypothetical protein
MSPASTSVTTSSNLGRNRLCVSALKSGGAGSTPDCAKATIRSALAGALAGRASADKISLNSAVRGKRA